MTNHQSSPTKTERLRAWLRFEVIAWAIVSALGRLCGWLSSVLWGV